LQQRQEGTGLWLLQSSPFTKWHNQQNSFLWLHGIPGCGKTILSSTIIEHLVDTHPDQLLLYFYFDFTDAGKQTLDNVIRSLISQLYDKRKDTRKLLDLLFSSCNNGRRQPTCELLCNVFLQMINQAQEIYIVLDALDECRTRKGPLSEGLLAWIRSLQDLKQRNVHLLVTSRPEHDIELVLRKLAQSNKDILPIQSDLIEDDIRSYVHTRVRTGDGLKRWRSRPDVLDEIQRVLMEKAQGM
jgi:Cdc6-like AAA superfamily ATPase